MLHSTRDDDLAGRVHAQLVGLFYATRPAVVIVAGAGIALIGGAATWRTGDELLGVLTVVGFISNLAVAFLLGRSPSIPADDNQRVRRLEYSLAIPSICAAGAVGAMAARGLAIADDALIHLLLIALTLSALGSVTRNFCRPRLVFFQLALLTLPGALVTLTKTDPLYWVLAAGSILLGYTYSQVVQTLYQRTHEGILRDYHLARQNVQFEAALHNMSQGLCMFDADQRLMIANQQWLDIYNFSPEVVNPGVTLREVLQHSIEVGNHSHDSVDQIYAEFAEKLLVDHHIVFENRLDDGRIIIASHEPIDGGGWVTTHEDATARKAAEGRAELMQAQLIHMSRVSAMGQMASALAHELNQPLAAVSNYIRGTRRILGRTDDSSIDLAVSALASAEDAAMRAGEIIRHLREMVAGGVSQKEEDVQELVSQISSIALVDAKLLGVEVKVEVAPGCPPVVGDKVQIQQVLLNLMRNGMQAMEGQAERKLVVTANPIPAGAVLFSVADTGAGVSNSILEDLFTPFRSTKEDGMGVGLSICRTIVEAHGGKIWCERSGGNGTVFNFTIPACSDRSQRDADGDHSVRRAL